MILINFLYVLGGIAFVFCSIKAAALYLDIFKRIGSDLFKPFGFFLSWNKYTNKEQEGLIVWTIGAMFSCAFIALVFLVVENVT